MSSLVREEDRLSHEEQRPRRAPALGVAERHAVLAALAQVAQRINGIQKDAILTFAMVEHSSTAAGQRLTTLRATVAETRVQFEAAVDGLPDELRKHGRVTDLRKALTSLEERLSTA